MSFFPAICKQVSALSWISSLENPQKCLGADHELNFCEKYSVGAIADAQCSRLTATCEDASCSPLHLPRVSETNRNPEMKSRPSPCIPGDGKTKVVRPISDTVCPSVTVVYPRSSKCMGWISNLCRPSFKWLLYSDLKLAPQRPSFLVSLWRNNLECFCQFCRRFDFDANPDTIAFNTKKLGSVKALTGAITIYSLRLSHRSICVMSNWVCYFRSRQLLVNAI